MIQHRFGSHTPEEMRRSSDLGHRIAGATFLLVGILALAFAANVAPWAPTAWGILILTSGALLLIGLYALHPPMDWVAIWNDPQQREHSIIAAILVISGAAELLRADNLVLGAIWPVGLLVIGSMFLTHAQHGTGAAVQRAVQQHRILGVTIMLAGLLRGTNLVAALKVLGFLWPVAGITAAVVLLVYREPEGAYEADSVHGQHH